MKYCAKLHHKVLAACDSDLLGKTFSEGRLKLAVKKDFYFGKRPVSRAELEELMKKAEILNLVGKGVIGVAAGLGMRGRPLKIAGVPHLQILKLVKSHGCA